MNDKQTYQVVQPVHLHGLGTVEPGATVELYPRQAVFLLTSGVLEQVKPAAPKPGKRATQTKEVNS